MGTKISALKNAARAVIFISLVVMIFIFLSKSFAVSGNSSEDGMESRISSAYRGEAENTLDVIFVGNSDVYRGVSPVDLYHDTGITSAVAGRPNNTLKEISSDIDDILKYQKPKVIVLETDCMFSGTNSHYKKHKAETTTIFTKIKKAAGDADSAIISAINYYFPLVKYHDRWKKLSLSSFIDRNRNFYKFRNKGMAYSEKVSPYTAGNSYMEPSEGKSAALSRKNKAAFDEINEKCRDNGIRLVLITVPSANTWSDAKSQAVRELAKQSGLTYYDYNRSFPPGFDWKLHTTDGGNHLNYAGAVTVTRDFGLKLKNDLKLPKSQLTDQQKKEWQQDYRDFHRDVSKI